MIRLAMGISRLTILVSCLSTLAGAACAGEIHKAVKAKYIPRIEQLLDEGGATLANSRAEGGSTPLHWAAGAGKVNTMEVLISLGADVDALSDSDATPLHQAVLQHHPEAVKLLIRSNADLNSQNKSGYTPLDYATANGWADLAELLQTAGAVPGKSL